MVFGFSVEYQPDFYFLRKKTLNMVKLISFVIFLFIFLEINAQPVEVRADYNSAGDVHFVAYNNTKAPLFLNIRFDDLENTTFDEPLPYVRKLESGFNSLFSLLHDPGAGDYPRFHYDIKYFRSNPAARVDLDFPYLLPFQPGRVVQSLTVENINGFWGLAPLKSWSATGFKVQQGQKVFASRTGIITEIVTARRETNVMLFYNGWNYTITLLQPDGTLACYKNVVDVNNRLKVGQKVFAGQQLGEVSPGATELLFLVFHESFVSDEPVFVIPEFVVSEAEKK
jgi:hypothetical protein